MKDLNIPEEEKKISKAIDDMLPDEEQSVKDFVFTREKEPESHWEKLNYKPVCIVWHDARLYTGTYTKDECEKVKMCLFTTLGYLLEKDDITTIIAEEYNDEGDYRNIMLIPTGSIISIQNMKLVTAV